MFKGINRVIKAYIYWDLVINAAWGLLGPIFVIFLLERVAAGDLARGAKIAGFSSLVYWIVKSVLQIPIGRYLDKNHGEKDDFWFFFFGIIITGLSPFGFLISFVPWHIYLFQALHAIGMAMIIPSSYAIFIRHCDKGKEAYESSLDSTLLGVGAGVTGAIGGIIFAYVGFEIIFIIAGVGTLLSSILIFAIKKEMHPKVPRNIHELPLQSETPQTL
ncbi:MFS transporter [Patescibacteria group bacterium]|nr:MFS transporter [Patescibacteria group bacterium]